MRGGNVMLKVDMAKAYDRMDWGFIYSILEAFGFNQLWIDRIRRCISECRFSVLLNGQPCGFFSSSRGLRQGDPISPSLFIIAADYFSRLLTQRFQTYLTMQYRHGGSTSVSHLAFADDMIIFTNGQKRSIRRVIDCLEHYDGVSRQLVNRDKSGHILPRRASEIQTRRIVFLTGFSHQSQPFTYLGVPLFKGAKRSFLYDDLIMKVRSRIFGWASRLLSPGGRITLLRFVLSSIPLYLFQIMRPPKVILKRLESIFARFLWDSKDHARRLHWRSWKAICLPADEGGLGFRRLLDTVDTFSLKLWWMFRSQSSLWAQFLLGKYCRGTHPSLAAVPQSASPIWKRLKRFGPCAEAHIAWCLGLGKIFFWHDCWMGDSILASIFPHRQHTTARVQDFFEETG